MRQLIQQKAQLSIGKAYRAAYVRSPASDFQSRRESDLICQRQSKVNEQGKYRMQVLQIFLTRENTLQPTGLQFLLQGHSR